MKTSEKVKALGFKSLQEFSELSGESLRSIQNWDTAYPRRIELIAKGLMFEKVTGQINEVFEGIVKEGREAKKGGLLSMKTEFDLDTVVTIVCPTHGDFQMRAGDHIGENAERIAYGCPKCGDNKNLGEE